MLVVLILIPYVLYLKTDKVQVLMYHFTGTEEEAQKDPLVVSQDTFEKQLAYLSAWG